MVLAFVIFTLNSLKLHYRTISVHAPSDRIVLARGRFRIGAKEGLNSEDLGLRGCLAQLHELCSTNSIMEQLHKKLEFVEYLFRCSHNSTIFSRIECVELKLFG